MNLVKKELHVLLALALESTKIARANWILVDAIGQQNPLAEYRLEIKWCSKFLAALFFQWLRCTGVGPRWARAKMPIAVQSSTNKLLSCELFCYQGIFVVYDPFWNVTPSNTKKKLSLKRQMETINNSCPCTVQCTANTFDIKSYISMTASSPRKQILLAGRFACIIIRTTMPAEK